MDTATTPTAARYAAASAPLTAVIDAVPTDAWQRPSACEGWTAADVVAHLIDTQRDFLARHGVDLGPTPAVADDPAAAWATHAATVAPLLDDPGLVDTAFDGYFGPTTVGEVVVRFYVTDMVVHRWDIARAVGLDETISDAELDQLELDIGGYGDAAYAPGVFAPALEAPAGADRQTTVLARTGRRAW